MLKYFFQYKKFSIHISFKILFILVINKIMNIINNLLKRYCILLIML